MLVKGPLGIVSNTEIVFFLMFIALLLWSFASYVHNSFPKITPKAAELYGMKAYISFPFKNTFFFVNVRILIFTGC